ncbi:LexA family transcriptional repressor [Vibrio parahaemolyticus]|nr:LexA family transcriptional repressor [Vibrio parahaemolyticus]
MKTAEEIRRENARELASQMGSNAAFADKIDRSSTQVSRFMGKGATTEIGPRMARHIEQCFNKPEGWLDVDHSSKNEPIPPSQRETAENIAKQLGENSEFIDTSKLKAVPILTEVQAGEWARIIIDADTEFEWQTISVKTSADAFAMRVTGNSMTNPYGSPSIPDGSIVIVEPCNCPDNGKIVVATLNDAPQATIKKLEIDGPNKFLVPLNPKYDPIPINGNCRIVGYVKQVIMDL